MAVTGSKTSGPNGNKKDRRAALVKGNGFWILLQVLLVWTGVCVVLLNVDLESDASDSQVNYWIWLFIVVPWLLFLVRYLWLYASPLAEETSYPVDREVWRECFAMVHFALERGRTPEAADMQVIHDYSDEGCWGKPDAERIPRLAAAHERLSKLVAPAMPKTLVLISTHDPADLAGRRDDFAWLGSVKVAKAMLGLAAALLPAFIALALVKGTALDSSEGLFQGNFADKALTATYLLVASALGASFAGLFKVRKYVENLSYDDQYESSYWVRYVLGLVAGLILSVSLAPLLPSGTAGEEQEFRITLPILALVGGFSSDLVYRILKRLIDAIETLIEGSSSEAKEATKLSSEARLREQEIRADQGRQQLLLDAQKKEIALMLEVLREIPEDGAAGTALRAKINERLLSVVGHAAANGEPVTDAEEAVAPSQADGGNAKPDG